MQKPTQLRDALAWNKERFETSACELPGIETLSAFALAAQQAGDVGIRSRRAEEIALIDKIETERDEE